MSALQVIDMPPRPSGAPTITVVKGEPHKAAEAGMRALIGANCPIYRRDVQLVMPTKIKARNTAGKEIEVPGIVQVTTPILLAELARVAGWQRANHKGEMMRINPPADVVAIILAHVPTWEFLTISGVTGTPYLRPDGSIVTAEGFDPVTGRVLLAPPHIDPIADQPTRADAESALQLLTDLLTEFPFVSEIDRAVALSILMTPVIRPALGAAVPLHGVRAPDAGTGKSYLLDIAAMIATGSECATIGAPGDQDELDKVLGAEILRGSPVIGIDNVNGRLGSSFLCRAITNPRIGVRPLGTSTKVEATNTWTLFANGDNILLPGDMVRRAIIARMDPDVENPELREFRGDPLGRVTADRGFYVRAILTIVRAYVTAGHPGKPKPLASFSGWSDLVRGALMWLRCADPVASIQESRADDPERGKLALLLETFPGEQERYRTAELIAAANETDEHDKPVRPEFLAAVRAAGRDRRGNITAEALGYWLRGQRNRVAGGWKLVRSGTETRPEWGRERRWSCGDRGDCGDVSIASRVNLGGADEK
jgi:putative DNA primase/helicase